jgi:hypothetical protein
MYDIVKDGPILSPHSLKSTNLYDFLIATLQKEKFPIPNAIKDFESIIFTNRNICLLNAILPEKPSQ